MAEASAFLAKKRYAVITGGNKGIGLESCRQLASNGVVVILTSRDVKRGLEAFEDLKQSGLNPNNLEFHQLDVTDPTSISSLADFIDAKFGKLDILVNNAAILGSVCDWSSLRAAGLGTPGAQVNYAEMVTETYELTEECLKTNYYGVKRTIEALLPLLNLSDSPRIINVSSSEGKLNNIPNERVRGILGDAENLTEERVDEILNKFLSDFRDGSVTKKGWPYTYSTSYFVSKAAMSAYTRILAKKYPSIIVNCICPGYVRTDINDNTGHLSVEEGGANLVRLALMPHCSSSGLFYVRHEISSFE